MKRIWLIVALVALAGCGGGDEGGSEGGGAAEQLARAADKAAAAKTYEATADFQGAGFEMKVDMVGTTDGSRTHMTGDMKTQGRTLSMEMVTFGTDQYMRSDAFDGQLPKGKQWLRMSDDTPSSSMPIDDFFKYLRGSKGFKELGTEEVGGRQTTHYGGPFDLEEFTKFAGPEAAASFRNTPGAGNVDMRLEVWIDDEDLPARLRFDASEKGKRESVISATMDFVEFGVPAEFEKPDASAVADPADLRTG